MQKLKELNAKYEKLRDEFQKVTLSELKDTMNDIFQKYPDLVKVGWTQYAPHFNDGDPCEFNYHGLNSLGQEELNNEIDSDWVHNGIERNKYPELEELDDVLRNVPDDIMKFVFGSDSKIEIDRKEILIEDYSENHD
jgi:hypothetical protein